jgi:protein tyrosine/serine phosphatase
LLLVIGGLACAGLYLLERGRQGAGESSAGGYRKSKVSAAVQRKWAQPLELAGVENFHKVSDELYRGAQPSAEGMKQLAKLGVKTVVNLRSFHSDRDEIGQTPLAYEHIYMKPWHPEDKEVVRFLKIISDANRTPVFVHCQRGADRTGTMCAIYRIVVEGWSKMEAIEEMTKGGFGFYPGWQNIVNYVLQLDIDAIKSRAGLKD